MKRILLILALIFMIVSPVLSQTGSLTTNEYFYLPEYGSYGTDEYDEYNTYMEVADNQIAANKISLVLRVKEKNTSNIVKGQPVYISGATGQAFPKVGLADADSAGKTYPIGLAAEAISKNTPGIIMIEGVLEGVDSLGATAINPGNETWVANQLLYLHTIAGGLTKTEPTVGRVVEIGHSLYGSSNTDAIHIHIQVTHPHIEVVAGEDVIIRLGDSAGSNKFIIKDYANNIVAYTDSDGIATFASYTNKLSAFAATSSSELAGVISDETGSGALVFANTPTLVTPELGVATATNLVVTPESQYPPAQSDTYVKATTKISTLYYPHFATDPTTLLTGQSSYNSWVANNETTNQRFHIDLGSTKIIKRIYYENMHGNGSNTNRGIQNFTFWGSNTGVGSFDDLVWGNDDGWTVITVSQNTFDQHIGANQADPKYITVINTTAYRYYAFKFVDNYGGTPYMGVRRIELQTAGEITTSTLIVDGGIGETEPHIILAEGGTIKWDIYNDPDDDALQIKAGATLVIELDTSGNLDVKSGVTATSINLGETTLDVYEEGTWTPGITFGGNSANMTYDYQTGLYTKIGRQVTVTCYLLLSAKGDSTGNALVTGLPFTCKNAIGAYAAVLLQLKNISFANVFQGQVTINTTSIAFGEVTEAGNFTYLTEADFEDTSEIIISATYFTD